MDRQEVLGGRDVPFPIAVQKHGGTYVRRPLMSSPLRLRHGAIRLPIVEVEFAIRVMNDPKFRTTLVGDRRQIVDTALRILDEAKQDQIDGRIELNEQDARILLLAIGTTQAWMHDLLFFRFEDDEQN